MTIDPGSDAPAVSALNQDGEEVTPTFDDPTVLYFYPRDETPGCTTEAREFQRELDAYRDAGVTVYGVSTDDVDSHRSFCDAADLEFDLLADPDAELVEAFDIERIRGAAARTTIVLADTEVKRVYEDVSPDGHARAVLGDLLDDGLAELPDVS
jgi:peroxiredoxin Q/BCP